MNISVRNLSFGYSEKTLFRDFSADFHGGKLPLVILGPSGSGKTTLLKLLGGLLKPDAGTINFSGDAARPDQNAGGQNADKPAFMFQESRLLPWLTVLENVSIPLQKRFGIEGARARARFFLSLVSDRKSVV